MYKVAFNFGSLTVHWYGVCVALGFMAGLWTATRRGLRAGFAPEQITDLGLWLMGGGVLGARLLYVLVNWRDYFGHLPWYELFMIQRGGLVFYGGFLGAALAGAWFARRHRLPFWRLADVLAPSVALGHVFGRLGCFFNGCCYGCETEVPWAVHFPAFHETHGAAVHPSQLYEATANLALYAALAWLFRRRRFDGQVFSAYLMTYAVLRAFLELFRGDYPPVQRLGLLTPAHAISALLLVAGFLAWRHRSRQPALPPAQP